MSKANEHEAVGTASYNKHRPHTVDSTPSKRCKDFDFTNSDIEQDTVLSLQYGFTSPVDQWSFTKVEVNNSNSSIMPLIDEFDPPPFTEQNSASRLSGQSSRETSKHNSNMASVLVQTTPPAATEEADMKFNVIQETVELPAKEQAPPPDDVYIPGMQSISKAQQLQAEKEKRQAMEEEQRVARERERRQKAEFQAAKEAMLTQSKVQSVGFGSLKAGLSRKDFRNMSNAAIHNVAAIAAMNTDVNLAALGDSPAMSNSSNNRKRASTADNFKRVSFLSDTTSSIQAPPVDDGVDNSNSVRTYDDMLTLSSHSGRPHTTGIASYDDLLSPFDTTYQPVISPVTTAHGEDGSIDDNNSVNSSTTRQLGSPSSLSRLMSFTGGSEIKLKPRTSSKSRRSKKQSRQQRAANTAAVDDKESLRSMLDDTVDNYSSTEELVNDNVSSVTAWGTGSLVKPKPSDVSGAVAALDGSGFLPSVLFGTWPTAPNSGRIVPLASDSLDAEDALAHTITVNTTLPTSFKHSNNNNNVNHDDDADVEMLPPPSRQNVVEELDDEFDLLDSTTPSKTQSKPLFDSQKQQLLMKQAESIKSSLKTPKNPAHYQGALENAYSDLDSDERADFAFYSSDESFVPPNKLHTVASFVSPSLLDHNYQPQQQKMLLSGDNGDDNDSVDVQEQQAPVTVRRKPKSRRNKRAKLIITMDD